MVLHWAFPLVRREMKAKLAAFLCGGADFLLRASVFFRRSIKDKHRAANLVAGEWNIGGTNASHNNNKCFPSFQVFFLLSTMVTNLGHTDPTTCLTTQLTQQVFFFLFVSLILSPPYHYHYLSFFFFVNSLTNLLMNASARLLMRPAFSRARRRFQRLTLYSEQMESMVRFSAMTTIRAGIIALVRALSL